MIHQGQQCHSIHQCINYGNCRHSYFSYYNHICTLHLPGQDNNSWGLSHKGVLWHGKKCRKYCDVFLKQGEVIGVHLDLYRGTLSYFIDDKAQGIAFTDLNTVGQALYPVICSTPGGTEMAVTWKTCRFFSLEEKCYHTITSALRCRADIDKLVLPTVMKSHLKEIRRF